MGDMLPLLSWRIGLVMLVAIAALQTGPRSAALAAPQPAADQMPVFELDRSWPKPLPNDWAFGEAWGIAVDSRDHPWVLHSTNHKDPSIREMLAKQGKRLAPPVVEFDAQGSVVQAWGGPGQGYSWME